MDKIIKSQLETWQVDGIKKIDSAIYRCVSRVTGQSRKTLWDDPSDQSRRDARSLYIHLLQKHLTPLQVDCLLAGHATRTQFNTSVRRHNRLMANEDKRYMRLRERAAQAVARHLLAVRHGL